MLYSLRSTHLSFRNSFDDVTLINFRFRLLVTWSSPHGRDTSFDKIWCRYLIQSGVIDTFPKSKMAAVAILDFQVMWICLLRRVNSEVFVLCTECAANICYSHWDRRTYASDFHSMTSRELSPIFDFSSHDHLRMAVKHLPIKFGADIFIQSGVIQFFPKFKLAVAVVLDFQFMWI